MPNGIAVGGSGTRELVVERTHDAQRELVFAAWTGPNPRDAPSATWELR
jgi:hypothetical protein